MPYHTSIAFHALSAPPILGQHPWMAAGCPGAFLRRRLTRNEKSLIIRRSVALRGTRRREISNLFGTEKTMSLFAGTWDRWRWDAAALKYSADRAVFPAFSQVIWTPPNDIDAVVREPQPENTRTRFATLAGSAIEETCLMREKPARAIRFGRCASFREAAAKRPGVATQMGHTTSTPRKTIVFASSNFVQRWRHSGRCARFTLGFRRRLWGCKSEKPPTANKTVLRGRRRPSNSVRAVPPR